MNTLFHTFTRLLIMFFSPVRVVPANKTENCVLRDAARRLWQGVLCFQKVTWFHDTRNFSVIYDSNKSTDLIFADSQEIHCINSFILVLKLHVSMRLRPHVQYEPILVKITHARQPFVKNTHT